jgi:hypothetical protein
MTAFTLPRQTCRQPVGRGRRSRGKPNASSHLRFGAFSPLGRTTSLAAHCCGTATNGVGSKACMAYEGGAPLSSGPRANTDTAW